jgi:Putative prokaryotic signal transducing protein
MADLVPLTVVPTEAEAELLCALLRTEGIDCDHRSTNLGAGAMDGLPGGGPREIVVEEHGVARAREILAASRRS